MTGAPDPFEELLAVILELQRELHRVGERTWADWLQRAAAQVAGGDSNGVDRIVTAFGGMGSFNDLVIHPVNGHEVAESDVGEFNLRVARLREHLHGLARDLQRELDR